MTPAPRPPSASARSAADLRDLLRRASFSRNGLEDVLGASGDVLSRPEDRPVHLRRLRGDGFLETLIRLFLLDEPVAAETVALALAPTRLEMLVETGVVAEDGDRVHGTVRIVPYGELLLASDLPDPSASHPDLVAGLHRPSITLADLTVRRPVRRALDVGTGFGLQALLASRHAEQVIATDINERALAFAVFNAALNDIHNIEFRAGSFFEPVEGETFGLVACNPPYVISPETEYVFRDSGLGRDRVSERLVGELPRHLDEGGFGTIMAAWIQEGDDVTTRPAEWLRNSGCDAWILHTGVEDALTTAAGWNREQAVDEGRYSAAIDRWLAYFNSEGIDAIAYGAVVLRRRDATHPAGVGPNWIRSRQLPNEPRSQSADHLLRLFTGTDLTIAATNDALLSEHLALAPGAAITTTVRRTTAGWREAAELTLRAGIPFGAELDHATAQLLMGLDGIRALGDVLDTFAVAHHAPPERVRASGLGLVRQLLELGVVSPVPAGPPVSAAEPADAVSGD